MTNETGGPAFPQTYETCKEHMVGMTMRDYFAAKILQGAISGALAQGAMLDGDQMLPVAKTAYKMADAMLEARK